MRLLGRSWRIRNGRGAVVGQRVPRGSPGVVGQTPVLIPGHGSFVYNSSAEIDTPTGDMQVDHYARTSAGFEGLAASEALCAHV